MRRRTHPRFARVVSMLPSTIADLVDAGAFTHRNAAGQLLRKCAARGLVESSGRLGRRRVFVATARGEALVLLREAR